MTISNIIAVLEDLAVQHQSFLELGHEKTEVIKQGDIKRLEQIVREEEALSKKVQQLEAQRLQLVQNYLKSRGFLMENVTLEELIPLTPLDARDVLKVVQQKLINAVVSLKAVNDLNRELIQQSLLFVNLSMNLLKPNKTSLPNNYQKPNSKLRTHPDREPMRFDSKA